MKTLNNLQIDGVIDIHFAYCQKSGESGIVQFIVI